MFYDPRAKGQSTWPPQRHQTVHWLGHRFVGNALNAGPCQRQPLDLNSVFCPIASNLSLASPPPLSIRPPARQQAYNQGEHHPLLPFLCPTLSLCQTSLEHFAPPAPPVPTPHPPPSTGCLFHLLHINTCHIHIWQVCPTVLWSSAPSHSRCLLQHSLWTSTSGLKDKSRATSLPYL